MGVYGGNSTIVGVKISSETGTPQISSISIPSNASQVLISNSTGVSVYISLSEQGLDTDYSRFEWPTDTTKRFILPPGIGQLWITAKDPVDPPGEAFVSFWLA